MRSFALSVMFAALSLMPLAGPAAAQSARPSHAAVLLAQGQGEQQPEGWWEQQQGQGDELRQRYWRLPPPARYRYDQLEGQIRQLWARLQQNKVEQRRILKWGN